MLLLLLLYSFLKLIISLGFREEELQLQKLKKRKVKVDPRLSFCDDFENGNEDEDSETSKCIFRFSEN